MRKHTCQCIAAANKRLLTRIALLKVAGLGTPLTKTETKTLEKGPETEAEPARTAAALGQRLGRRKIRESAENSDALACVARGASENR
jgi:hypothetical protein